MGPAAAAVSGLLWLIAQPVQLACSLGDHCSLGAVARQQRCKYIGPTSCPPAAALPYNAQPVPARPPPPHLVVQPPEHLHALQHLLMRLALRGRGHDHQRTEGGARQGPQHAVAGGLRGQEGKGSGARGGGAAVWAL